MREANVINIKFMCEEQHTHKRGPETSNMYGLVHQSLAAGPAAR